MTRPTPKELRKKAMPLIGVALGMLGMAYAAVPLYDLFCRVTGFGGRPMERTEAASHVIDREVTVRFDASTTAGMPWQFRPLQKTATLKIGETGLAFYEAHNPTDRPITGTASFNVTPFSMGGYFVKIDCFCFVEQTLEPGETVQMPVTYYVDPEVMEDNEASLVTHVTLSYTFYETEPERQAALEPAPDTTRDTN